MNAEVNNLTMSSFLSELFNLTTMNYEMNNVTSLNLEVDNFTSSNAEMNNLTINYENNFTKINSKMNNFTTTSSEANNKFTSMISEVNSFTSMSYMQSTSVGNVSSDNGSGVWMSEDQHEPTGACCVPGTERIVVPLIFSLVVLGGWVGNALVISVVGKNRGYLRNTTNLFILNLAIADLLFLTFCVPFHAVIYTTPTWPFGEVLCKLVHFVQYSSMVASIFTLVAMSADRYCAVAYALQTKHLRTPTTAFVTSLSIWLCSSLIAAPWPIVYTVKTYHDVAPYPVTICSDDWGGLRHTRPGYFLSLFILAYVIPLAAIFALSVLMVRQLWILKEPEGPSMRASVSAKRKVTRLIIVMVVVFCLCWLPSHVIWLWTNYSLHTWRYTYTFYYFRIAAHVLAYGNSAMNPLIYAFLSENFRKGFRYALRSTCCGGGGVSGGGGQTRNGGVVTQRVVFSNPSFSFSAH